jgi:hypothetical protein
MENVTATITTEAELLAKLEALGPVSEETRNSVTCSLVGHSRIQTTFFGYFYCARCGDQVGDSLGSIYPAAAQAVVVGHDCEVCQKNYAECTWQDKVFAPDPFKKADPDAPPVD